MSHIEHKDPQGTEGWANARIGVITGSRAKDARAFKKNGDSASERIAYAQDLARQRCGGKVASTYVNAAMRTGTEEEPFAAIEYMARTGRMVEEVGFITTADRRFGLSLDRRIPAENAAIEIKTMVSSATLFKAVVDGDVSEYRDQCLFALWMLGLDWIDLCLWSPDLPNPLHIVRIERDEDEIQKLEDDLMAFEALVASYERRLRAVIATEDPVDATPAAPTESSPPWNTPAPTSPAELPANLFA